MMYIHGNNETDKTINVSKIANTSTLDDNSTAAGCNVVVYTDIYTNDLITAYLTYLLIIDKQTDI